MSSRATNSAADGSRRWCSRSLTSPPKTTPAGSILQPISGFRLNAIGGPQVEVRSERIVSYGIRRCEFDEYLLRRSGARLHEGEPITSIERSDGGWLVNSEYPLASSGRRWRTFLSCRALSRQQRSPAPVLAQEIEFEMDPRPSGRIENRRRSSRTFLLPRYARLRLDFSQGQLPECRARPHRFARNIPPRERFRQLSESDTRRRNSGQRNRWPSAIGTPVWFPGIGSSAMLSPVFLS